jgi:hypothetical protein
MFAQLKSQLLPSLPGWSRTQTSTPPAEDDAAEEEDLDVPPPFPLLNSHQRLQAPPATSSGPSKMALPPTFSLAPPSPPREAEDAPSDLNIAILPDATPIGDMAPPPSTTIKPTFGIQAGGEADAPVVKAKGKKGKVALAPGCSALDWARLTLSGKDLKGTGQGFMRVTKDELAKVS